MAVDYRRYAVYYAPPRQSALGRFGAAWLGWDAETGAEVVAPDLAGLPRPRAEIVASPARYGFHGTLKAPFRLNIRADLEAVDRTLRDLAAEHIQFNFAVKLAAIEQFLALIAVEAVPELDALAAACVKRLDIFRAPSTPDEMARRDPTRLIGREVEYLAAWGYPYVFEHFRFHLTLTGALSPSEQASTAEVLTRALAPVVAEPVAFEDLCLFGEAADGRFHVLSRHRLRAGRL